MSTKKIYDITVIGAGPVGLFGVFYAGMRQMSINLIDSLPQVGGQLSALYPEKYIYDMPGFPRVMAKDLVKDLWQQAQIGQPDLNLNQKITRLQKVGDGQEQYFELHTDNQKIFYTKTVMLALGMGAFQPRKVEAPGLAEREGHTVHYIVQALDTYNNQDIMIVGGGDSAADWSLAMAKPDENGKVRARSTTIVHRGTKFTAHEASITELETTKAKFFMQNEIFSVVDGEHSGQKKLLVTLINNVTQAKTDIYVDKMIVCAGYIAKLDFVKELGLAMQGAAIKVNEQMETSIQGIYAVGDVCAHGGKLKLIATGVGEAAMAANFAKVRVDPAAKAFPGHSTSKMEQKTHS